MRIKKIDVRCLQQCLTLYPCALNKYYNYFQDLPLFTLITICLGILSFVDWKHPSLGIQWFLILSSSWYCSMNDAISIIIVFSGDCEGGIICNLKQDMPVANILGVKLGFISWMQLPGVLPDGKLPQVSRVTMSAYGQISFQDTFSFEG